MSLATRCPACSTVFRVVRDQLKVSDGWVRCGRCAEVFNAAQRLFELEPGAAAPPPERPAAVVHHLPLRDGAILGPATARMGAALAPPSAAVVPLGSAGAPADIAPADTADEAPTETAAETADEISAQPSVAALAAAPASIEAPMSVPVPVPVPAPAPMPVPAPAPMEQPPDEAAAAAQPGAVSEPMPEFVRRADRAARWRHPARRALLAGVALLLTLTLAAQIALHYRDSVAAAWPATQPALLAACRLLDCRIEPPRRIDSLHVDSSGLVRAEGSPWYRLSLVVQNKASTVVRMPAIDLTLTDPLGQTVVRRVFSAAELGHAADALPARGELALQALLDLGERRVTGYTVELFYP